MEKYSNRLIPLRLRDDVGLQPAIRKPKIMSITQLEQVLANARAGKADAQFLMSQICQQENDLEGMMFWLQEACNAGFPDALGALGHCYEKGQGVAANIAKAMSYYDRAVDAGSKISAFHEAQLLHKSKQGVESAERICELLQAAASSDVVPALRVLGYLAMQNEPQRDIAIEVLRRAATLGDAVSAFMLAWCLLQGQDSGDSPEAVHWLGYAVGANFPLAAELLASLSGTEPSAPPSDANSLLKIDTSFALYPPMRQVETGILSTDPEITLFRDVLDVVDRAYLIYLSRPFLQPAHVINPDGDESGMISNVRTSKSTYIPFELVDIIGRYIELKIVTATNEDFLASEPMSILCYAPGEYYRPHFDYFNPKLNVSDKLMQDGGQRVSSAVTYLTAPAAGGGTSFPSLNVTVPPVAGGTLWFRNCLSDGQVDKRSLHAGDAVIVGEKWVVTKWFREEPTQYAQI